MDASSHDLSKTSLKRIEQYQDRWSTFGRHTGILVISDKPSAKVLREFEIFRDYDDAFLEKISPDVSIVVWRQGVVLFEQGSYLDLAFFVADGEVDVYLEGVGDPTAGGQPLPIFDPTPIFDTTRTIATTVTEAPKPEDDERQPSPDAGSPGPGTSSGRATRKGHEITFLATMDFDLPRGEGARLGPGELFGEIGAMSGWPQSVTARTATECRLVQIRIPALRLMKRKSALLKERIDNLYRQRALHHQLKSTPLFRGLNDMYLTALEEVLELVSYEPGEVVVDESTAVDAIYMVRSGFLKLSQRFGGGDIAVSYLSKGMMLGEVEMLIEEDGRWEVTATSVEYAELVKVPAHVFRRVLADVPEVEETVWRSATERLKEIGASRRDITRSEFTRVALERGLVQGNSVLLIDLETCTRCDDCVRACAATHGGRPRFVREGEKVGNLLVARSCYHCRDPVCLVGCPTGAIHRSGFDAVIDVDDEICIGCSTCANNCPYDAIVMHETGEVWPDDMVPSALRGQDRRVASKCDLCHDTSHGPACVSNCPQGCAFRIGSVEEIQAYLAKK